MERKSETSPNGLDSGVAKLLASSSQNDHTLKVSLVHAFGKEIELKDEFALRPYETHALRGAQTQRPPSSVLKRKRSYKRNNAASADSGDSASSAPKDAEDLVDFFINCDAQVRCIDLAHNHVYSGLGNSVLMLVATNSTSHELLDDKEYCTLLQLFSVSLGANSGETNDPGVDLKLLCLSPIENDFCVKLRWVKINYDTGFLFAVFLMKSGHVKICRFSVAAILKSLESSPLADRVVEAECLWQNNPEPPRKCTSFDVAYNVEKSLVTLACATNDGLLLMWEFNLSLFQSQVLEVEREFISSHKAVPVICGINNSLLYREITDVSFLPFLNSYVLAIGTFAKGIILWDTRFGHLEGEIKSYHNIIKPINCVAWSSNNQYLLGCTSTGLFIDWQNRQNAVTVTSEKLTKQRSGNLLENICWSVDSSDDSLFYVFDTGENVQLSSSSLTKKNIYENFSILKWKLSKESADNYEFYNTSDSVVESVNFAMKNKFLHDLKEARKLGVTIVKSDASDPGQAPKTQVHNKVFALNTVKTLGVEASNRKFKLMAYGGNLGLVHVVLRVVHLLGK